MGFDSIYKLSVIMSMVDNITRPMQQASQQTQNTIAKLDGLSKAFGDVTQIGVATTALGQGITNAVLQPVTATWDTKQALGELASLGVEDLGTLESAAKSFSDQWAGTSKADFISAAYDIKSGISSLTDEGVADCTRLAALTATATKATAGEMTSLFATGYGIYKGYYSDMSDLEFGQMFSAGIADSVRQFKTTGSDMAAAIQNLGASATTANVPLEEQLAILGMLQATMPGAQAGTKYRAFLQAVTKGGEELGLEFLDAGNNLKSLPEILDQLKGKFGETMDAAEKLELQNAFGSAEAVSVIDLLYSKTGDLQNNILSLYDTMQSGEGAATSMAEAINNTDPSKYELLWQKLHNVSETLGNTLQPTVDKYLGKAGELTDKASDWISNHEELAGTIMQIALACGIALTAVGAFLSVFGGFGLLITKGITIATRFGGVLRTLPGLLETLQIYGLYAGDMVHAAMLKIQSGGQAAIAGVRNLASSMLTFAKTAAFNGVTAVKNFVLSMASMARQAVTTAVTAMPGLISSVWSFTAALLANPVTWIVAGIVALIAALIALWMNWDQVVEFCSDVWDGFVGGIRDTIDRVAGWFGSLPAAVQVVLAVLFPFIGIPLLIKNNWGSITDFFSGLWNDAANAFQSGIDRVKSFFDGLPEWFRESGRKVMTTFTEGIKSVISNPAKAVQDGLAKVRQLLPFSDAKEGPLSTLTLSGQRVMETFSGGIDSASDLPADRVRSAFEQVDLSARWKTENADLGTTDASPSADREKKVVIEKVVLNVDLRQIEDLKKLKKLLLEIEDYANSGTGMDNGDATGGEDYA